MKIYISSAIKPVDSLPKNSNIAKRDLTPKNYAERIYADLKEAYDKHIETFEFVGDYNINNFTSYCKPVVDNLIKELIIPEIKETVKSKFKSELNRDITYMKPYKEISRLQGWGTFIKVVGITQEDGKHYYGQIDFSYADEITDKVIKAIKLELGDEQHRKNERRKSREQR